MPEEKREIQFDNSPITIIEELFFDNHSQIIEILASKNQKQASLKGKRRETLSNILSNELSRLLPQQGLLPSLAPTISTQDANFYQAIEHFPESFGQVVLLFIKASLGGACCHALVDTGAQASILCSSIVAQNKQISDLVDKRFTGIARGVGQSAIMGRIHSIELTLWQEGPKQEAVVLPCSFHVMDMTNSGKITMILGLDMLKRHQVILNMEKNHLSVHGYKISFLCEWELPKNPANR